jgi:hypothetical protein
MVLLLLFAAFAIAQSPSCADQPYYSLLDFWVGKWDVYVGEEKVGDNRIEKILQGCAVMEHWKGSGGGEGKSLFFVDEAGKWKQIWVTQWATNPGGVKEKSMVDAEAKNAVRFLGELRHPDVGAWFDRTTLTTLDNGDVRQVIEVSKDNGVSWEITFDAVYRRVKDTDIASE